MAGRVQVQSWLKKRHEREFNFCQPVEQKKRRRENRTCDKKKTNKTNRRRGKRWFARSKPTSATTNQSARGRLNRSNSDKSSRRDHSSNSSPCHTREPSQRCTQIVTRSHHTHIRLLHRCRLVYNLPVRTKPLVMGKISPSTTAPGGMIPFSEGSENRQETAYSRSQTIASKRQKQKTKELTNAFRLLLESNASAMVSGVRGVSGFASTKVAGFMMLPSFSRSSTSNTRLAFGGTMGVTPSAPYPYREVHLSLFFFFGKVYVTPSCVTLGMVVCIVARKNTLKSEVLYIG